MKTSFLHHWSRATFLMVAFAAVLGARSSRADVDITLLGRANLPSSIFLINVVGYVDQSTSREYAILCDLYDQVYIVDVTDPADMRVTAHITGIPGYDVKTWDHYLYACDGNDAFNDSRVVDIADPANPIVLPTGFASAHAFQVSSSGIMYAEYPGLRIYDLNTTPTAPALLFETGGYGHDSMPKGTDRLYDFSGIDATIIWDVTNPSDPDTLGLIDDPTIQFHHSGDVTADQNHLYICDELSTGSNADITIWNIAQPSTPQRVGQIADPATVHNIYVVGNRAYVAYYSAGFRVYDISNPTRPLLEGQYDTSKRSGEGFIGAIGAYVYLPSGNFLVADVENGVFAFSVTTAVASQTPADATFQLAQNFPNPFNPATRIPFELTRGGRVALSIFDVAGHRVRALLDQDLPAGLHEAAWDGRDDAGQAVASGVYLYRMQAGARTETRRMVLLK
jgi:choice-of-anchor B domain-containing protein